MPELEVPATDLKNGAIWPVKLLVLARFAASNGEARTLLKQGAVELDGVHVTDEKSDVSVRDGALLRVGRHRFVRLRLPRQDRGTGSR